jgi:hypothetical protein
VVAPLGSSRCRVSLWDSVKSMFAVGPDDVPGGGQIADEEIAEIVATSEANKPIQYRQEIHRALAYLRGQAQPYVLLSLQKQFPETAEFMQPLQLGLYTRLMVERGRTFAGDGQKFELYRDGKVVAEAGGVKWEDVLRDAGLVQKLIDLDRRADAARSFFLRPGWHNARGCVDLTLFEPSRTHLPLSPDARDIEECEAVALELSPIRDPRTTASGGGSQIREKRRFEHWTAPQNKPPPSEDDVESEEEDESDGPMLRIVDDDGTVHFKAPNPYYDETDLDEHKQPKSVIPLVRFATLDTDDGYWQLPDGALLGAAEAVDAQFTNAWHIQKLNGYGQWKAEQDGSGDAEDWPGKVDRGPEVFMRIPRGWKAEHVTQDAPTDSMSRAVTEFIRHIAGVASLPPGSVIQDGARQVPSGAALLVERAPLDELRRDRILMYQRSVERLLNLIRIVWNAHQPSNKTRFLNCTPKWTPGDVRPPIDPLQQSQIDDANIKLGTWSPVRCLMRDEGLSRDEAMKRIAEIAEENRVRVASTCATSRRRSFLRGNCRPARRRRPPRTSRRSRPRVSRASSPTRTRSRRRSEPWPMRTQARCSSSSRRPPSLRRAGRGRSKSSRKHSRTLAPGRSTASSSSPRRTATTSSRTPAWTTWPDTSA